MIGLYLCRQRPTVPHFRVRYNRPALSDVLLQIGQALVGAIVALVGYRLTTRKPKELPVAAKRTQPFFLLLLCLSVLFGSVQGYRAYQASERLSAQLGNIESATGKSRHTYLQLYDPMPVTNDPYLPFRVGEKPNVAINMVNSGDYQVKSAFSATALFLLRREAMTDPALQDKACAYFKARTSKEYGTAGTIAPHSQEGRYNTVTTDDPLTFEQVARLSDGSLRLCALARVVWEDDTGQYCTTYFRCLQKDEGKQLVTFNWHVTAPTYNQEVPCKFELH
jgi:hypothetical protein